MLELITIDFPLQRTHCGLPLGNGTMGILVWGGHNILRLTIGRADLWDHRGGMSHWTDKQNLHNIRKSLEQNNTALLENMIAGDSDGQHRTPTKPSIIPLGRFDLIFPADCRLVKAELNLRRAEIKVFLKKGEKCYTLVACIAMDECHGRIIIPEDLDVQIKSVPSWDYLQKQLSAVSFAEPERYENNNRHGWFQPFPADPGVCAICRKNANRLDIVSSRENNLADALLSMQLVLEKNNADPADPSRLYWWEQFWNDIPQIELPNPKLINLYYFGLYKFACLTNPSGVPATLQGPWIEEYGLPPWSSDYHFNINVQMCYSPAYKANKARHLLPLFHMVWSWRGRLRENAKAFVGIDDGYMLPLAVDDRGTCGRHWSGTIDHACSAWIANMMYDYYRYTLDRDFLKETAFPFMYGVMRVYEMMLERDGETFALPVGVSPEYCVPESSPSHRSDSRNSWGCNAGFQLAAIHRLLRDLVDAGKVLDLALPPIWSQIIHGLPETVTLEKGTDKERLALWEGVDLDESHRHHSHLAAIWPFDTCDPFAPKYQSILANTVSRWTEKGMGLWSGWSMPWASIIHSRLGNGTMAELLLEIWDKVFTNSGCGSLHDPTVFGFSSLCAPSLTCPDGSGRGGLPERMQIDGAMGVVTAIQEMFLHICNDIVYVMHGIPPNWKDCTFRDMPCGKGFYISAKRFNYQLCQIEIKSGCGGTLYIHSPWPQAALHGAGIMQRNADVLFLTLPPGSSAIITAEEQICQD